MPPKSPLRSNSVAAQLGKAAACLLKRSFNGHGGMMPPPGAAAAGQHFGHGATQGMLAGQGLPQRINTPGHTQGYQLPAAFQQGWSAGNVAGGVANAGAAAAGMPTPGAAMMSPPQPTQPPGQLAQAMPPQM